MTNSQFKKMRAEKYNYERWLKINAQYYDQRPECKPVRGGRSSFRSKAFISAALVMGAW